MVNPTCHRGGITSPFRKMQFIKNFTWVSDYIIEKLFKWMHYVPFDTFIGILPHIGHVLGAPKVKKCNFWKIENGRQCPYSASKKKV